LETSEDRYEDYCQAREGDAYLRHSARFCVNTAPPLEEEHAEFCSGDVLESLRRERDAARGSAQVARLRRFVLLAEDCVLDALGGDARRELARTPSRPIEARAELREASFLARGQGLQRLGYSNGAARARSRLPAVDVEHWQREASRYLELTEGIYAEECKRVLPALGIPETSPDSAQTAVVDHLGARFDELFPGGRALQCLSLLAGPMGVDPGRVSSLRFDSEEREGRVPGVAPFTIEIPHHVVLSLGVSSGPSAYVSTFFAVGRALAAGFTAESLPPLRRRPFDRALPRAWGWLFSDRFADPIWLEEFPAGRHSDALLRAMRFRQFFAQRRAAGRMLFALRLAEIPAGSDPRRLADQFTDLMQLATRFAYAAPLYLEMQDAELGAMDELRGRSFASALAEHLRQRFGWRFWRERAAGELLKELWNTGSSYTVEELAEELDLGGLDLAGWIDSAARGV